tara:strand:+ start:434 stop:577 length:144 start_codon:yes stop_codon:yes gene_type:complete
MNDGDLFLEDKKKSPDLKNEEDKMKFDAAPKVEDNYNSKKPEIDFFG